MAACAGRTAKLPPAATSPVPEVVAAPTPAGDTARPTAPEERPEASPGTPAVATPQPGDSVSPGEVTKEAVKLFGDSTAAQVTVESDSGDSEEITWDIDVRSYETQERVEHWVQLFTHEARERIEQRLERGTRYEPMIRAKLKGAGLPEDMVYLSLIESGFNPHAYSRAAAVGLWQFMTPTARGSGLRVDWWVDERRDPVRSTDAAMKFINHLKNQFGSLYIAAAAYNGGPGRLARGLKKFEDELEGITGDDAFFALAEKKYLPAETKDYVPKLIAAALVGKNPEKYGMKVERLPPYAYDSVTVPASTPLTAIAKAAGVPLQQISELNTHILRGVTPPTGPLQVRIPVGTVAAFDTAFPTLDSTDLAAFRKYTVKGKQTMASVAGKYDLTEKQLGWYNPKVVKSKSGRLQLGQVMRIPTRTVVLAALDVPDPEIAIWSSSRRVHIVKRGENLSTIAKKYKTTVKVIMRRNGLKRAMIMPGQSLVVGGPAAKPPVRKTSRSASSKKAPVARPAATKKVAPAKPAATSKSSGSSNGSPSTKKKGAP
jgi:membrane-bound lytic murein transglycosylase D